MKKLTIVTLLVAAISFSSFGQTPNVTSSDINYWVGNGSNEAIFVAYLCHEDAGNAYAWGYRWSGTATVEQMLRDIDIADSRLTITITSWLEEIVYTGAGTNDDCSGMWGYMVNDSWGSSIQSQPLQNGDIVSFYCTMCSWGDDLDQINIIPVQPVFTIHAGLGDEWASQLYGAVSPVGDSTVVAGSSITYFFTPNPGYRLGSLTLGGVEKIQDVVDNTYTVSNIREDNTLWALFAIDGNNTVTADDIVYWVGEGSSEVIFVVNWCEPEMAFAWGYRFSGEKVLVSKVMDDIKAADSRFDYDAPGGYVGDISYTDDTYNLTTVAGEYWAYNINEASAATIGSQYVFDGDVIEFGGTSCGLTDDFWNNVWTTAITAVSVPETIGIASRENTTVNVSIYPNPTTDYTSISINGIEGTVSMKIADINGKIIQAEQFQVNDSAVKRIETNVFAKGIYFIHLQNKDVVETQKLIVY